MAWKTSANSPLGISPPNGIADPNIVNQVGTIAKFVDELLGEGEFIYLPGVASCAAGDLVLYDLSPVSVTITRHTNATGSNSGRPLAIALGPTLAGQFGWFQISGATIVNAVAGTAIGPAFGSATAGQVSSTVDAGDQIMNARISSAVGVPAAGKCYMTLNRPHVQGQIT